MRETERQRDRGGEEIMEKYSSFLPSHDVKNMWLGFHDYTVLLQERGKSSFVKVNKKISQF
jgi:hypothetical protein